MVGPTLEGSGRDRRWSIATDEKRVFLPPKEDTYGNIEGLMQQFKLVMHGHGVRAPEGEVYFPVEGAKLPRTRSTDDNRVVSENSIGLMLPSDDSSVADHPVVP